MSPKVSDRPPGADRAATAVRFRKSHKKARTGCRTCKIRRVKCGEERPQCHRCIQGSYVCDGYGDAPLHPAAATTSRNHRPIPLPPKSRPTSQLVIKDPVASLFKNEKERRYFDNFCANTSYEILPDFNSGVLRQMLLQGVQENPSIRHALVALGALDAEEKAKRDREFVTLTALSRFQLDALEQYTIALKLMQRAFSSGRQDVRILLLECFATVSIEAWCGNFLGAGMHAWGGLRLIHDRIRAVLESGTRVVGSPSLGTADMVEAELLRAFSGLDMEVPKPSGPEDIPDQFELESLDVLSKMPEVFTTIRDAQMYKNVLRLQTSRFISRQIPSSPILDGEGPFIGWCGPSENASDVVAAHKFISDSISRWKAAFDPLWKKLQLESQPTRLPAVILNVQVKYIAFDLLASSTDDQSVFDSHTDDFRETIELAEYVLGNSESGRRHFHLESQIVLPLCMTAAKCRDKDIRMKALSLTFEYPRREGILDGQFLGQAVEWIVKLEEDYRIEGKIPNWARIQHLLGTPDGSAVRLRCFQKTSALSDEAVERRTVVYQGKL